MNFYVEMTGNQFQQNISVELTSNFLDTISTRNVIKFSVNLTEFFNSGVYYMPFSDDSDMSSIFSFQAFKNSANFCPNETALSQS